MSNEDQRKKQAKGLPSAHGDPASPAPPDPNLSLAKLAQALIAFASPDDIADIVLSYAKEFTASPHGFVGHLDPATGDLVCPTMTKDMWEQCGIAGKGAVFPHPKGLYGWVMDHKAPLLANDPAADPRSVGVPEGHLPIRRYLGVPAMVGERLLGQVAVANAPRDYTPEDQANLERLAALYALALERAQREALLEERVKERTADLMAVNAKLRLAGLQRQKAQAELEAFFQASPDVLCIAGADGHFKRVNPAFEKLLGYSAQEIMCRHYLELIHPDDRERSLAEAPRAFSPQGTRGFENRYLRKDGSWVWLSWTAMPAADGGTTYAVGRDISLRKQALQALEESEARFRLMADASPALIWLADVDGKCNFFNRPWLEFTGRTLEEEVGEGWAQGVHPQDREAMLANYMAAFRARRPFTLEYRLRRADGQYCWVMDRGVPRLDAEGRFAGYVGVGVDISERRQAEQETRLQHERQTALLMLHRMADAPRQQVCDFALDQVVKLTRSQYGYLYFMSEDQSTLSVYSWSKGVTDVCAVPGQPGVYQVDKTGLWGEAVRQRRPIITNDYATSPWRRGAPEGHVPLTRHMNAPVFEGTRIVAVAGVANKDEDYDESDVRQLQLVMDGMWSILKRQQAEQALRESEEKFAKAFRAGPMFMTLTSLADGRFLDVNDAVTEATGFTREELVGQTTREVGLWADPADRDRVMETVRATGAARGIDLRVRIKSGEIRNVLCSTERILISGQDCLLTTAIDITDRRRTEQALAESEERYREVVEGTADLVTQVDAQGRFTFVNHMARKVFGLSPQQCLGLSAFDFVHPDDRQGTLEAFAAWLERKPETIVIQNRQVSRDGTVRHMHWTSTPHYDQRGEVAFINGIARDITELKRAEEALRASEEKFAKAFQNAPIWVVLSSFDDGRYLEVNDTFVDNTGFTRDEAIGRTPLELGIWITAEEREEAVRKIKQEGGLREHPVRFRMKSGEIRNFLVSSELIALSDGQALLSVAFDVTDRMRAEQALRASEERFRALYENAPMPYQSLDDEGVILDVNPAWLETLGYQDKSEVVGRWFGDFLLPGFVPHFRENFPGLKETGRAQGVQFQMARKDGATIHVAFDRRAAYGPDGRFLRTHCVFQDITDRMRAEQALRASEEKFRLVSSLAPAGIFLTDPRGGCLYANDEWQRIAGLTQEQALGDGWARALHPEDRDKVFQEWNIATSAGAGFAGDYRFQTPEGEVHWVYCQAAPLTGPQGEITGYLGTVTDITKRMALEEQARKAQKMESLAIMAGGVAHDFNNLLQSVLGNADLALLDTPPSSPVADHLREVQSAAQRAAILSHKMLAYSGHTPYIPRPLDLAALMREMLPQIRASLPYWIVLDADIMPDPPRISGDEAQIRQAVRNLVTNAVEALGENKGTITITVTSHDCTREFLGRTYVDEGLGEGEYVCLQVADTGPGMDAATAARAFDPFFTTKFPGRGLGLPVVLGMVRSHRGAVLLDTNPGQGARVSLFFPSSQLLLQGAEAEAGPPPEAPILLLVDDEEAVRMVSKRMLEKHGFAVLTAADGLEALETLEKSGQAVRAVLLDLNMPGLSGEALARRVREAAPGVPIIISSSLEQDQARARLTMVKPEGFLQKPYRMASLVATVRQVLEQMKKD